MKFSEFFKKTPDRDIASRLHAATKISLDDASREKMRAFLSEYSHMRPMRSDATLHASRTTRESFASFMFRPMPMIAFALLLIMSTGGGVFTAAEGTLPGDLLYPIKVHFNEEIQAAMTTSPQASAEWAVTRAERRLEEAATLSLTGQLTDVRRAQIETSLASHIQSVGTDQLMLAQEHDQSNASRVSESVAALQFAKRNILGDSSAKETAHMAATSADIADEPVAMSLSAEAPQAPAAKAAIQTSLQAAPSPRAAVKTATSSEDRSLVRAHGSRTAAKVRIEAARRFLQSQTQLDEKVRTRATEELQIAAETLGAGDEKSSRGESKDAASEFEHALEKATEAGLLLLQQKED